LPEKIFFVLALITSLAGVVCTFRRMIRVIQRGQGSLHTHRLFRRALTALFTLVAQPRLPRQRPLVAFFHYAVAWGFLCFLVANVVDVAEAWLSGYRFLDGRAAAGPYRLLIDVISAAILASITFFLARRFLVRSTLLAIPSNVTLHQNARQSISTDSLIVGLFILGHVGFRLLAASFRIACEGVDIWQPAAGTVALLFASWSPESLEVAWHTSWWLAIGLILVFVPAFPRSKHAHLFMGPFNFLTRPERTSPGTLDALDFSDPTADRFGAERLTDLAQTQIVDAFACIMCNRCQDVCPAHITGKELSPAALEINKRLQFNENLKHLASGGEDTSALLGDVISESALWSCLGCGACEDVCPVGNEPMHDIMDIRRSSVLMKGEFPAQLRNSYTGLERNANPWQMSEDRTEWTTDLDFALPTVAENKDYDVLYWVGCAGAFDPRARQTARAIATLLHKAGVNAAILGNDEACTGDMARRTGNEYLFNELAGQNIQTLKDAGADKKKIVSGCPHCVHTLKNEYPALGGNFGVSHHSEFLLNLVEKGKLGQEGSTSEKVTFHDPCYLGRQNGVYDAPREVLKAAGADVSEMGRARRESFCCGGGGGQAWKEEEPGEKAVSDERYSEAAATGAETLAVGCPFCTRMLGDANDRQNSAMKVRDIAEILLDAT